MKDRDPRETGNKVTRGHSCSLPRELPAAAQGGGQAEPSRLQMAMRSGENMAAAVCRAEYREESAAQKDNLGSLQTVGRDQHTHEETT